MFIALYKVLRNPSICIGLFYFVYLNSNATEGLNRQLGKNNEDKNGEEEIIVINRLLLLFFHPSQSYAAMLNCSALH